MSARDRLCESLAKHAEEAAAWKSPMYSAFATAMRRDVEAGGPTWNLLEPYADEPADEYYAFRALAAVHHQVIAGELPELAKHYPSVGGDGDAEAAWPLVRERFAAHSPEVLATLRHPLQTNETARCGALIGGFLVAARDTGLALRVREVGSSAGLNLHFDRYRYEAVGRAFGPADSPVRFVDHWEGGAPPFDVPMEIASRRGCDLDPIDATSEDGRLSLLSYIFCDQMPRYELLREAIEVARAYPVTVDRESLDEWAARELADPPDGEATIVFHSLVWIYLPEDVRRRTRSVFEAAAEAADVRRPFGWLCYELDPDLLRCELRLTLWPGGEDRLLGRGDVHLAPVEWLEEDR